MLWCAAVTLRLVLAAYGLENVRPYRVDAGRSNEHWYVGAGLVLRRYGPFRCDAAIDCEHAIAAFFIDRHVDGDHGALDQIRLGLDLLLRAEQRWPALRAAILNGTTS